MDMTPEQIAILTTLALCQLVAMGLPYWAGLNAGWRRGNAHGYRTGFDAAEDKYLAELNETAARSSSAERLLRATGAELRQMRDRYTRELLNAREAYEAQSLKLADAQVLNEQHARLLRQASGKFYWLAPKLGLLQLVDEERHCATLANQLGDLASWLHPQTQQRERAA